MKFEEAIVKISNDIFSDKNMAGPYPIKVLQGSGLKCVDVKGYRIIQQNPNTTTRFADAANRGFRITWVLKGKMYTGQGTVNGRFFSNMHTVDFINYT